MPSSDEGKANHRTRVILEAVLKIMDQRADNFLSLAESPESPRGEERGPRRG